jgi:SAM-dependent methyltransferase
MIDNALKIKGFMSAHELRWLADRAREAEVIVEFGSYLGRSTRALGDNAKGVVWAVDTWSPIYPDKNGNPTGIVSDNSYTTFCENLEDLIQAYKVMPVQMPSQSFELPFNSLADFVFIDGDHRYEAVVEDIKTAMRLLKPGGIMAGHDYNHSDWPGVQRAVIHMVPKYEVYHSIWWTEV